VTDSQKTELASEILLNIQKTSFTLSCKQDQNNQIEEFNFGNIFVKTYHTNFSEKVIFEVNGSSIVIPKEIDLKPLKTIDDNKCDYSAVGALINKLKEYMLTGMKDQQIINTEIIAFSITNSDQIFEINDGKKTRIR